MKSQIRIALGVGLLVPILLVGTVRAVEETTTTANTTQTDTTTKTEAKLTEEQQKKLNERVQKRKTEAKQKLTVLQEKRLQARCKSSQVKIKPLNTRATAIESNRAKVHANLVDSFTKLQEKLQAKNVDTTKLQAEITVLQAKINTFNNDLGEYREAISDTAIMDCEADPVAFKASLEVARVALQKVHADAKAIRTHVVTVIKPILQDIRVELAKTNKDADATTSETN